MSFTCQMLYLSLFCWIINSTEHRNYEYEHKNCMVVFHSFLLVLSSYQPYIINAFYPSTCSPYLIFRFHLGWKNRYSTWQLSNGFSLLACKRQRWICLKSHFSFDLNWIVANKVRIIFFSARFFSLSTISMNQI